MKILFIEAFYGGSHKQLIETLIEWIDTLSMKYELVTLPAKKWPWRARCSALMLSQLIPKDDKYTTLFCSSVLSLSELLGLRPDLQKLNKIVYFHENQLEYPIQSVKERDYQYGYNQITTCLSADVVLFNSYYNLKSFIHNINKFIKLMPDCKPKKDLAVEINTKSRIMYFPITFSSIPTESNRCNSVLRILWPHRWEFDKGPETFFKVLFQLKEADLKFQVYVLGQTFKKVPEIFDKAKKELENEILEFGYVESKERYYEILGKSHVVVSTAIHEFYGVAMLEAVYSGCLPLAPNDLVYPEIYDIKCLYNNEKDLLFKLTQYCKFPHIVQELRKNMNVDYSKYDSLVLKDEYFEILQNKN